MIRAFAVLLLLAVQEPGLDEKILGRADKLLEEAKVAYESGRDKRSVADFVEAGFKLEEARIKYQVVQEIGSPEKQKTAAERLRAVNQLTKLIHDGKTAISGAAAEPAPPPAEAGKPAPPAEPAARPVDVTRRLPVPEAARQAAAEKQIRDVFKEQYAKKSAADRRALVRQLLDQAARSGDDPAALWVLCREAQDAAAQIPDPDAILRAVEAVARVFDVDAPAMRTVALQAAGKAAKTAEDFAAVADAQIRLTDELVAVDQFDAADKAAASALQLAKKSADASLTLRATLRAREIAEAKSLYQSSKSVIAILAKSPDDPVANAEMGKFLCFVKGSWDLGVRFLVKGTADVLKTLAESELAASTASADRVTLADGWWEQAEKEKSPLRKSQMVLHAKTIYESALPDATALAKAKIEKRLAEAAQIVPDSSAGPVDLLRLLEERDSVAGTWKIEGGKLRSPSTAGASRIQIPYTPPAEYSLTVVAERKEGTNCLMVGLSSEGHQFRVQVDGWPSGDVTSLDGIEGAMLENNPTVKKGKFLPRGKASTVVVTVRKTGVTASLDGKTLFDWKGSPTSLNGNPQWGTPNKSALYLGGWETQFEITKVVLTPISGGAGKRLR